jgi:hypothetical protein
MADSDFTTLDGISTMFLPSDMNGSVATSLGGSIDKIGDNSNPYKLLMSILENSGRGVYNLQDIENKINEIKGNPDLGGVDLSNYLTIWTNEKIVSVGSNTPKHQIATNPDGSPYNVSSLQEVIGGDYQLRDGFGMGVIITRSPFFNPANRNTKRGELFMNNMPSTVLSQLVPYMQVEFQFSRDPADQLQTGGLLKFLLGAADTTTFDGANKAMTDADIRRLPIVDGTGAKQGELDYMGMEAFTSPQTLVNPLPNQSVGTAGDRYTDVIDPFRPFASLEHVNINSVPTGAGYFCYKKANLTLKIHDRSRLNEISDLLRPRVYTGVTIWMTYGWRAPSRAGQNPYFDYINNNMMMREAYHIVNSNFSFDQMGQVTVNLELFTKGVAEMRDLKVTDNDDDSAFRMRQVKALIEKISYYRQRLKLDPPEGLNKEMRIFQILDAAETGNFPEMKANDVNTNIDTLKKNLEKNATVDKTALSGLINSLKQLYTPDQRDKTKYTLKEEYDHRAANQVQKMFKEVQTGFDPFLPSSAKSTPYDSDDNELAQICDSLNSAPASKVDTALHRVVSFGKLFSVFALRATNSIPETVDEVQVFFYSLNESCGPVSSKNIAEFPIDLPQFMDQFTDTAKQRGGDKITLEDFLGLCINAQFLDNRAPGYGLRQYYEPYAKGKDAQVKSGKDNEQAFENRLASYNKQYGPFKKPVVEMYIECSHERVSDAGQNDVLQVLAYSATTDTSVSIKDAKGKSTRKIMRIHVYDKQTNTHRAASQFFKNPFNSGFIATPSNDYAKSLLPKGPSDNPLFSAFMQYQEDEASGRVQISQFTDAQQLKNALAQLVPTIRFGSNGSTISSANLASKAEPLLSTVQMIRSQTIKNTAAPNGAGAMGLPLRVIPAQLSMTSLGNPLATNAQKYFIDFQTGTTLDNLYIVVNYTHAFSPGKFETSWQFGYADGYGVFEGAPNIVDQITQLDPSIPKDPAP